jgi:hypothetical protein
VRHGTDIPDDLTGLIHQLDGSAGHVPEVIHGVPTLILDCDERDFSLGGEQVGSGRIAILEIRTPNLLVHLV